MGHGEVTRPSAVGPAIVSDLPGAVRCVGIPPSAVVTDTGDEPGAGEYAEGLARTDKDFSSGRSWVIHGGRGHPARSTECS
jgi:hypothetical protein